MAKTYEGRIYLKSGGSSVAVRAEANSPSAAKKIIEAQFAGQIKRWARSPNPVKK